MPILQTMRGRIVDLRRHTNVHLYWRGRFGPAERYELWLRDAAGLEHQFAIHTRTLPARRGHEVTLLTDASMVCGIVNWSTGMHVNYLHVDSPPLLRLRDLLVPPALLVALATRLDDLGLLLFLPATLLYFLIAVMVRYTDCRLRARAIQRALREVQRQISGDRFARQHNRRDTGR
jgi:hypothetical protein